MKSEKKQENMENTRTLKYNVARFAVLDYIVSHSLKVGDKLPGERELVKLLPVSMITLRRALLELQATGHIERRIGGRNAGTYVRRFSAEGEPERFVLFIHQEKSDDEQAVNAEATPYLMAFRRYFYPRELAVRFINVQKFSGDVINVAKGASAICASGELTEEFLECLRALRLPTLIVGNYVNTCGFPSVRLDIVQAAYLMTREMIHRGLKKIVFFRGENGFNLWDESEKGYRNAMAESNLEPLVGKIQSKNGYFNELLRDFMPKHLDLEAVILFPPMLDRFISWLWAHDCHHHPAIGLIGVSRPMAEFDQSAQCKVAFFTPLGQVAAKVIYQALMTGKEPESKVIAPIIPPDFKE